MQNLLRSFSLILLLSSLSAGFEQLFAQCPGAETCEEAYVFCSLGALNGFSCSNTSTTPIPCNTGCNGAGPGPKANWWAFVSQGGFYTMTISVGGCTNCTSNCHNGANNLPGLEFIVWDSCACGSEILCVPVCSIPYTSNTWWNNTLLIPCKTYYISVDACCDCICDFTLYVTGAAGAPTLAPIDFINNVPSGIIEPVCAGACNYKLFVNPQPGGCVPSFYIWTLDGKEVGTNNNEIKLDFPDEGDFVICVTEYIGNPKSGSICSQQGPKCATVKVKKKPDLTGVPRTLCYEAANPVGYKWHSQTIFTTGIYREQLKDNNCCKYDSVVEFTVLSKPEPPDVYYITCNNEPYIDVLGRSYLPCKNQFEISLPKSTNPFKCDSAFKLTAVNVDFSPRWKIQCIGGQVEISPGISILKPCSAGETYRFDYRWYKKNDPSMKTISTDERLLVDAVNEDYCVDVNVHVDLGTSSANCPNTFCEMFNEGNFAPICFPLAGDQLLCLGKNGLYWIDTLLFQKVNSFIWTIDGGFIITKPDSQAVGVRWNLPAGDTGTICVFYNTDCGKSCEKCLKVAIKSVQPPEAGPDDSICNLSTKFQGKKVAGGLWTQISGPGNSIITDSTDPTSNVVVDKFGIYRFVYNEFNSGCISSDTVDLYFNSNPDSSALTYICNSKQTQYKLHFLVKGGLPPYIVVQGSGIIDANNYYISDFYDTLTSYKIIIRDAMGCVLRFDFSHDCNCTNAVGIINKSAENKCEDQNFTFVYDSSSQIVDPGDTIIFVVTTDPILENAVAGAFIKIIPSYVIVYDGGYMNYNTTYYIFVIIGKKDGKGGIDFKLGCVQADGPKPFMFFANSTPQTLAYISCDSFNFNGLSYFQTGVYSQVLFNSKGCDSIINLDLNILQGNKKLFSFNACDSVTFNGKIYTKSGDYTQSYTGVNGCDSIVNIHINIPNSNNSPLKLTKCDSVTINRSFYDQTGIYTQNLKSSNGCDSLLNIELTIAKSNSSVYQFTSCDSALINGQWYLQSGNYIQTLKNANQCDSTLNIDLNITKSTSGDTLFRSCDSVIINGVTYRQTGIYKQTLINSIQCDSILIIDFTRLSKNSTALNYKSCDSVVVNNQVYKQTGSYTQILANANQCDSVLNMDVIITKSNSSNSILSACDSVKVNGQSYYQSGNYVQRLTNADLCDSVLLLNVTIHKSTKIDYILKGCDSATLNKRVYTLTGVYKQILTNVNGCDSMMNLHVIIDTNTHAQLALTHCDSLVVNKQVYTLTGVYKQILTNTNGCDSTLILDLVIKPGNPSTLDAGADTSICEGEIIKLNGIFSGQANFFWHSANGSFDNPNNLTTNYYANAIGDERIYLQAADDCKQWSDSLAIHILPKQIVQVTGDTILNPCKEISFTASGGTNYTWTPSSFIECLDPPCSRVILKSSSVTRFTISSSGPCVVPANLNLSLSKIQTDVYLPNVFSPNGDNINDIFLPVFNCDQVDYYNLQIFDRWGNLIFESLNKEKGWNGKYQDVKMGPGVYAYLIQYQIHGSDRKVKAGDLTLIR